MGAAVFCLLPDGRTTFIRCRPRPQGGARAGRYSSATARQGMNIIHRRYLRTSRRRRRIEIVDTLARRGGGSFPGSLMIRNNSSIGSTFGIGSGADFAGSRCSLKSASSAMRVAVSRRSGFRVLPRIASARARSQDTICDPFRFRAQLLHSPASFAISIASRRANRPSAICSARGMIGSAIWLSSLQCSNWVIFAVPRLPAQDLIRAMSTIEEVIKRMDLCLLNAVPPMAFVLGDTPLPQSDLGHGFSVPLSQRLRCSPFLPKLRRPYSAGVSLHR